MSNLNFDAGSAVEVSPDTVSVMVEVYCDASGTIIRSFPLLDAAGKPQPVVVDAVSGTLSYYGLNWSWSRRLLGWFGFKGGISTAICGWIGNGQSNLLGFDIQGVGSKPVNFPVSAVFPGGVPLSAVLFNLDADLATPTDFRAALVFHRKA
jgi:hypothetical protein